MSVSSAPLVTLAMPTYNRPDLLKGALEGLRKQTYPNLEIIVSDNASKDRASIEEIKRAVAGDPRVTFHIQDKNIGFIPNILFLLGEGRGKYFMWVADDDFVDTSFVERAVRQIEANPNAVMSMSTWEVEDVMSSPPIRKDMSKYPVQLPAPDTYHRLKNYVSQPEYSDKARILWGLIKRDVLKLSFEEALEGKTIGGDLTMAELPVEFYVLMKGDLEMVRENLIRFALLPTSEGLREGSLFKNRMLDMCRRSFRAYQWALRKAPVTPNQKFVLRTILKAHEYFAIARVVPYYALQRYSPGLARVVKKIWTKLVIAG